jgi:hypothetical protein
MKTNIFNLPLTEIPSGEVELPVLKKTVRVRAMNIKEEKNLLTAKDAGEDADVVFSIKELVKACTYTDIDFTNMALPDVIASFIKIVELSKGPISHHTYICHNKTKGGTDCGGKISIDVDLRNVKFTGGAETNLVHLPNNIIVELRYPTPEIYKDAIEQSKDDQIDAKLRIYAYCIVSLVQNEEVYNEFSKEEIYDWLVALPETALIEFNKFFDSIPQASLTYDVKCPKCGYSETVKLTELEDFFM